MVLFITSSPFLEGANRPVYNPDNEFLHRLGTVLPERPRGLFVTAFPEEHELSCRIAEDMIDAFAEAHISFSQFYVLDRTNMEQAAEMVYDSDFIAFGGGHVPTQNAFLHEMGMRQIMEHFDGVVMGVSAGAMNLADVVYVQPEEPGESSPEFVRQRPGLGLTHCNIVPHYQKIKDSYLDGLRLFEDLIYPDSFGREIFVLVDGSYIYQDHEECTLLGEAYLLKDGQMHQLTANGESMRIW